MARPRLIPFGVLLIVLAGCNRQPPVRARQDTGPVQVRTAPVSVRELQRVVESVGSLFPFEEVIVSSEIDGRVTEVASDLGDRVEAGQVLVRVLMRSSAISWRRMRRSCGKRWSAWG